MSKLYYHVVNAGRGEIVPGVKFDIYDAVAGVAYGVYATDRYEEKSALEKVIANPRSAVTLITREEYEDLLKKKRPAKEWSPLSILTSPSQNPAVQMKGERAGIVVDSSPEIPPTPEAPVPMGKPLDKPEDAIRLSKEVKPADPIEAPAAEQKFATKRAKK